MVSFRSFKACLTSLSAVLWPNGLLRLRINSPGDRATSPLRLRRLMVSRAQRSAELRSSSVVVLNKETETNRMALTMSESTAISRQLIETSDSGLGSAKIGKIRNMNQIKTPATRPMTNPFLFACGQYSMAMMPGKNCRQAVNAMVPIISMLVRWSSK